MLASFVACSPSYDERKRREGTVPHSRCSLQRRAEPTSVPCPSPPIEVSDHRFDTRPLESRACPSPVDGGPVLGVARLHSARSCAACSRWSQRAPCSRRPSVRRLPLRPRPRIGSSVERSASSTFGRSSPLRLRRSSSAGRATVRSFHAAAMRSEASRCFSGSTTATRRCGSTAATTPMASSARSQWPAGRRSGATRAGDCRRSSTRGRTRSPARSSLPPEERGSSKLPRLCPGGRPVVRGPRGPAVRRRVRGRPLNAPCNRLSGRRSRCAAGGPSRGAGSGTCTHSDNAPGSPGALARLPRTGLPASPR